MAVRLPVLYGLDYSVYTRIARLQLLARAVGAINAIDADLAKEVHDYRHQEKHVNASFSYYARQVLRESPECLK